MPKSTTHEDEGFLLSDIQGQPYDSLASCRPPLFSSESELPPELPRGSSLLRRLRELACGISPASTPAAEDKDVAEAGGGEQDGDQTAEAGSIGFFSMSREKKVTLVTFCVSNFFVGAYISILAPFFPTEAQEKGVNSAVTGYVLGCCELSSFLMCPVFGNFITDIGGKFMCCAGLFLCGACGILFGFLDESPNGTPYIVMCILVRTFEGIGAGAFNTSMFAIMANMFPLNVVAIFGFLFCFVALGMMLGPPLGGALYQLGGFKLPIISTGGMILVLSFVTALVLPPQSDAKQKKGFSIIELMKIPVIPIMCYVILIGMMGLGFQDVGVAVFLTKNFALSPLLVGLVFLVAPGIYSVVVPIWGIISDKKPAWSEAIIIVGCMIAGCAQYFLGPAPFIRVPRDQLWLVLVSLALFGFGLATSIISTQVMTGAARNIGYPDSLETFGLISGIFNSFASLGLFIGPVAGGALIDVLGFEMASTIMGSFSLLGALMLLVYVLVKKGQSYWCGPLPSALLPS